MSLDFTQLQQPDAGEPAAPRAFRPSSQADLAPAGERAKLAANLETLVLLAALADSGQQAQPAEQAVLARWSGWGALAGVFDPARTEHEDARRSLAELLTPAELRAASRTTLNAHYTDAALAGAVWDALLAAGFSGGRVLEPGCGAGTFLGLAPTGALRAGDYPGHCACELIGIELDPTTAAIAAQLYPHAQIRAESFADTVLPVGSVDLAIGNVPFGKIVLHDPVDNPGRRSLHNHFILKALRLTRPGGVVAVLTSHWTLDATNPGARREMAELADLVAAVRLPSSAHEQAAGTRVLTDLLVLRRHDDDTASGRRPSPLAWEQALPAGHLPGAAGPRPTPGRTGPTVNEVFSSHPHWVIGDSIVRAGQYGPTVDVRFDGTVTDIAQQLRTLLTQALTAEAARRPGGRLFGPPAGPATNADQRRLLRSDAPAEHLQGHLAPADPNRPAAGFTVVAGGALITLPVPAAQTRELAALLALRDTTMALLSVEAADAADTPQLAGLRAELNTRYDQYYAAHGPINRVTLRRTGRVDPDTGAPKVARLRPPQGGFRADPHAPAVYALEHYDAASGAASKASIMGGRVIAPRAPRLGADTPGDALAICLDTHGEVRLPEIARLLGTDQHAARAELADLVFDDPQQPGRLLTAPEYLSGNVRIKLRAAEHAAQQAAAGTESPPAGSAEDLGTPESGQSLAPAEQSGGAAPVDWQVNIAALRRILPIDLTPAEIDARLGASWIDAQVTAQFLREILQDPSVQVENPGGSVWAVKGARYSVLATSTYGTSRMPAVDLAQAVLEQRPIRIIDELDDGRRVLNLTETVAAQDKAAVLHEAFAHWLWTDPDRALRLARLYNDTFNAIVLRHYDGKDASETAQQLPGLAVTFTPREHQRAAVARMVREPSVLLAHDVGAGKTASMIIGAMELRRLAMAAKPAVIVPNHMLEQFTREWLQLYPQARLLAAGTEDLAGDRRRLLVARVATGDWDAVILSRSAFERLPLTPQAHQAYLDGELEQLRTQLGRSRAAGGLTVKRLEAALARAEQRLAALTDTVRDPAVTFEQTGIDYLIVDEAHGYKNLRTASNIPGVAIDGSQRASDLDTKLSYLRSRHGRRVATFATATPIANSISEAYVMQRYLRPDVLTDAGITDFDTWAATFGEVTTNLELSPDGSSYRMASRFAKFRNVPELLRMWHLSADIKTATDLALPTPELAPGHPVTVVVPASAQLKELMCELSERAERVQARQVDPATDNMLRIATHGRMAALDLRLLGPRQPEQPEHPPDPPDPPDPQPRPDAQPGARELVPGEPTKLIYAADSIAAIHRSSVDLTYPPSAVPGALQLVSSDLGTPREGWNVYDELRRLLIDRGVPAEQIAFMHSARNDREKGELFAACRTGQIAVLLGSTERMGVGTNVQLRAVALHHLDCPWRPADLAQRDGRILRQGNANPSVQIYRYVTEGSFDAYLWQTVERKAQFIGQIMRGTLDVREIEDIGETALSYSEVKALATGDPRILDKAHADADIARLTRLERAHHRTRHTLTITTDRAADRLPDLHTELAQLTAAADRALDTRGEAFTARIHGPHNPHGGQKFTGRGDAAQALRLALLDMLADPHRTGGPAPASPVAELGGFTVLARATRHPEPHLTLQLAGVPRSALRITPSDLAAARPAGIITRLENRASSLANAGQDVRTEIDLLTAERDRASTELARPFAHTTALAQARQRSAQLAEQLTAPDPEPATADNPPPAAAAQALHAAQTPPAQTPPVRQPRQSPQARWQQACAALDPRLPEDPHWPALNAALDRVAHAGLDVPAALTALTADPLPQAHPARALHYRLVHLRDAARTPAGATSSNQDPARPVGPTDRPGQQQNCALAAPSPAGPRR